MEVEFRGWDVENKCWRYGYYQKRKEATLGAWGVTQKHIDENTKHYIIWDGWADWNMTNPCYRADVDPASIGMFIGEYDKNKKKIYSGDILAVDEGHWNDCWAAGVPDDSKVPDPRCAEHQIDIRLVEYQNMRDDIENGSIGYYIGYKLNQIEVIGNDYENKEMLYDIK